MRNRINFKFLPFILLFISTIIHAQNLNESSVISITPNSAVDLPHNSASAIENAINWTLNQVEFKSRGMYIHTQNSNRPSVLRFVKHNSTPSERFVKNESPLLGELMGLEIIGNSRNRKFKLYTSHHKNMNDANVITFDGNSTTVHLNIPESDQKLYFKLEDITENNSNHSINEIKLIFKNDVTIWNGSRWSNGIPTELKTAVLLDCPIHNFTAKKVIFGNDVTITSRRVIEVVNELDNSGGHHVVFEHNARVIQRNDVENKGIFHVKRKSKPLYRLDMMFWSSPVKNQNVFQLSPSTPHNMFFEHNEFRNVWESEHMNENSIFEVGKSLVFRVPDDFNPYNNGNGIAKVFDGTFIGELNNGDIIVPVKKERSGLNAIGNPYPSPISIQKFLEVNPNVLNIYVWDASYKKRPGGLENWVSFGLDDWNSARVESQYLNTATGFLVKLKNGAVNQTIKFTNDMRLDIDPTINFRTEEQDKYWLSLYHGEEFINSTMIAHLPNGSNQYNQAEDVMTLGTVEGISTMVQNANLSIQGRAMVNPAHDVVKLSVNIPENGTYTIALDKIRGRFASGEHTVYLKDNALAQWINLSEDHSYTFDAEKGISNDRFEIVYRERVLSSVEEELKEQEVIIYNVEQNIRIDASDHIQSIEIIGIDGKRIDYITGINQKTFTLSPLNKKQLVLFRITLSNEETIVKKYFY